MTHDTRRIFGKQADNATYSAGSSGVGADEGRAESREDGKGGNRQKV